MNLEKKNSRKIISIFALLFFILTQVLVTGTPVKAQTLSKAPITLSKTADKTQARVGDQVTLNYTIQPGDISVSSSDAPDKEIVMVMDTSASMDEYLQGYNSRLSVAKASAKRFIDKFSTDAKTKIGLVQYSNSASRNSNGLVSNSYFSNLKSSIDSFYPDGGTNTGDGLRLAYYMLKQSTNANAKKYIILFTDGEPTFYSYTSCTWNYSTRKYDYNFYTGDQDHSGYSINYSNDYTNGLAYADQIASVIPKDSGINSFMIGCTMSDYGINTLKEIAGKAKGTCSFVQTATDIDAVYDQLASKIQNDLPINSIRFQETLPSGIQIEQVPAGFTVSGQTITGDLGNITYQYSSSTSKYTASPVNFQIKVKTTQAGTYSLSKDANGVSNSFITYKDIDNTDGKLFFQVNDVNVANATASINLGKTVDKSTITANQPFNVTYTIQPDKIPIEDVDPSYQKGSDIVLVIDTSGSMQDTLNGSKSKINVAKDTADTFVKKFDGNSNINIALVNFNSSSSSVSLDNGDCFANMASGGYTSLHNKLYSSAFYPNGGTNIGDGLRVAYYLLKNLNDNKKKYLILMTDGMPTGFSYNTLYNEYDTDWWGRTYISGKNPWDDNGNVDYNVSQSGAKYSPYLNSGNNDYNGYSLNYAFKLSDIIKSDTTLNIKPIMIAFSKDADPSKLALIASRAGGEYKKALSETDMQSVYDSIGNQVQSDFSINGVQFEETFPKGINLQNSVLPDGFTKVQQQDQSWKVTGVLSSINYKLDSTGNFYEPLPVSGFTIQNLSGSAGANNTAAQYILGSSQTSFISYKDINGSMTKNPFPELTINIFPSAPADISATLAPKVGETDVYTLTITSNSGATNRIVNFEVDGTETSKTLWPLDTSGLTSSVSSKQKDLSKNDLIGNNSLCIKAKDQNGNNINETISLASITNVQLSDIEQNTKVRPGDITFTTEPNATITSLKINGQTVVTNQNTGSNGEYNCLGTQLKDGDNVIEVSLTNKFNNTSSMVLHQAIDATPPTITANYTFSNKKIDAVFSENVNLVWLECDVNGDGTISSDEKVTVSTDTINQLKDIQVPDNFQGKNIVIKARDLSGNIGSGIPVDTTPPQVQAVYTDNTSKIIDVTVDELVKVIWLECDVNKDGVISSDEKVVILNTIGTEVRGVKIPDSFYGRDITVKATDLAGNTGSTVLSKVLMPPSIVTPADGTVTSNNKPTITGTGEAGATVTVYDGVTPIGTAMVNSDGTWSLTLTTALADGVHVITATQSDAAGNISDRSNAVNITIAAVSNVVKKGIFVNGKLLDQDINLVRSFGVNIGIAIKTIFNGQDVKLQINKDSDSVNISNNAFDLYEVTDESSFTLNKVNTDPIIATVVKNIAGQEFTIPMDVNTVPTGYKYYLLVFKMDANRNASIGTVIGNTIKINSQQPLDKDGRPFTFDFNIVDLPPLN